MRDLEELEYVLKEVINMSCLVKREDKKINLNLKDKTYETIDEFQERIKNEEEVIDVSSIKKNFKIDHIDKKEFQKVVKEISLSQITRFYSVLENRNFSTGTDDKDLIKAKPFYEYYGKYFLRIDFTKDKAEKKIVEYSKEANLKNEIELTLIKAYVRYCIGKKKLESEGI